MPIKLLPSLLLSILLIGFTPGPANLFSLHCSMKNGTRKAMTMWFGLLAGFTIAAVIVAIITHLVGAMMGKYVVILKYIGCAYILLTSSLRHPKCPNGQKEALMTVGQGSASLSC